MKLIAYVLSFDIGKIVINFACFNSMLVGAFKRVFVRTISHYQTLRHVCRKVGGGGGGHRLHPMMANTGKLCPEGVPFSGFRCEKG